MAKILITRPEHDALTRHLSHWNSKIIKFAEEKGIDVIDLHKEKANKNEFEGRIKKVDPALVLLNGHGNEREITGHDNKTIIKEGDNEYLLKNRITYAATCRAAKSLGIICANEETTFIGYNESFVLNLDRRCLKDPLCDKRAENFLGPSNRIAWSLIKGHTCQEAYDNSQKAFRENIRSLLAKAKDPDSLEDIKDLFWNMSHQVCLGRGDARL